MSDIPAGDGWWLAADGKYYAPDVDPWTIGADGPVGSVAPTETLQPQIHQPADPPDLAETLARARSIATADPAPPEPTPPTPAPPLAAVAASLIDADPDDLDPVEAPSFVDTAAPVDMTPASTEPPATRPFEPKLVDPLNDATRDDVEIIEPAPVPIAPIATTGELSRDVVSVQRRYKAEVSALRSDIARLHADVAAAHYGSTVTTMGSAEERIAVRTWAIAVGRNVHSIARAHAETGPSGDPALPVGLMIQVDSGERYYRRFAEAQAAEVEALASSIVTTAGKAARDAQRRDAAVAVAVQNLNTKVRSTPELDRAEQELANALGVEVQRRSQPNWTLADVLRRSPAELTKDASSLRLSGHTSGTANLGASSLANAPRETISPIKKRAVPRQLPLMPIWGWAAAAVLIAVVISANLGGGNAPTLSEAIEPAEVAGTSELADPSAPTATAAPAPTPDDVASSFTLDLDPEQVAEATSEATEVPTLAMTDWVQTDPGQAFTAWGAFIETYLAELIDLATTGTADDMQASCNKAKADYDQEWSNSIDAVPDTTVQEQASRTDSQFGQALDLCIAGDIAGSTSALFDAEASFVETTGTLTEVLGQ